MNFYFGEYAGYPRRQTTQDLLRHSIKNTGYFIMTIISSQIDIIQMIFEEEVITL
jgi:hypothetical protein